MCFISRLVTAVGISLDGMRKHVMREIPGLAEKGISRDAIHILFQPPRKNLTRYEWYKTLTDAKFPRKRNQYREGSVNQHFLFASVSYREEFASKFVDEYALFSCDGMNKIKMGLSPAMSRYHQQHRLFTSNNPHNLGDHDFPIPGYMIVCSGYQSLVGKENVCEEEEYWATDLNDIHDDEALTNINLDIPQRSEGQNTFDKLRRKLSAVFIRTSSHGTPCCKFLPSTSEAHTNDLIPLLIPQLKAGKRIAFLRVDNGPDWNLLNVVNSLYFCRFWRDSELDVLGLCSSTVRYLAYNNIEHFWSQMSRRLASVVLPSVLEGDIVLPYKQTNLSMDEVREREAQVTFLLTC